MGKSTKTMCLVLFVSPFLCACIIDDFGCHWGEDDIYLILYLVVCYFISFGLRLKNIGVSRLSWEFLKFFNTGYNIVIIIIGVSDPPWKAVSLATTKR